MAPESDSEDAGGAPSTPAAAADQLGAHLGAITALLVGVSDDRARWKPDPSQWSMLEVVNHLADEEVEDFRRRLDLTLFHPGEPWPGIDPQEWVVRRAYNQRRLPESLRRFVAERERSIEWLRTLGRVDLDAACTHPKLGEIRAGDLLVSWLAHDLIHIRQLTRLHYRWLERSAALAQSPPYRLDYAGPF